MRGDVVLGSGAAVDSSLETLGGLDDLELEGVNLGHEVVTGGADWSGLELFFGELVELEEELNLGHGDPLAGEDPSPAALPLLLDHLAHDAPHFGQENYRYIRNIPIKCWKWICLSVSAQPFVMLFIKQAGRRRIFPQIYARNHETSHQMCHSESFHFHTTDDGDHFCVGQQITRTILYNILLLFPLNTETKVNFVLALIWWQNTKLC